MPVLEYCGYLVSGLFNKSFVIYLRELPKLTEIIDELGKKYDELAAMQAEAKIGSVSDACFG